MQVDQILVDLLEQTFQQTDKLLVQGDASWDTALEGVRTVVADLKIRYPGHSDWIEARLSDWLRGHAH
ncbi:hypothetical protein Ms3S1_15890 [Methylosinus sp. 3S-1]|uniref:Uncharacterized protein n=2 Tax=Methylocystaceae TaxID=31993 RepID=A0A2D2CYP1_METT3|nr:hypothetical protein CQW49_07950 [Methylosinus trichosporium OB3b]OBS51855.1 hypothetical protein A8B73_14475 [Methylosinus sp. 3S-1]